MKKFFKFLVLIIFVAVICVCIGKWIGKMSTPIITPSQTAQPTPVIATPEESEEPSKAPEIPAKSASGIYGGKADAHSVEIEFFDGSFEAFSVADGFFDELQSAEISEGDEINFKYIEKSGRKVITEIN